MAGEAADLLWRDLERREAAVLLAGKVADFGVPDADGMAARMLDGLERRRRRAAAGGCGRVWGAAGAALSRPGRAAGR